MELLNLDLLLLILKNLEFKDIKNFLLTQKKYSKYYSSEDFWRRLAFLTIPEFAKINEMPWKNLIYYYNNPIEKLSDVYQYGKYIVNSILIGKMKLVVTNQWNNEFYFEGIIIYSDKASFVGKINISKKTGKYYNKHGQLYYEGESEYIDGKYLVHGKGKMFFKDATFEGEFEKGHRKYGICNFSSGSVYEGNYKNNLQDGYGVFKFPSGSIYVGLWKEDKKDGFSTFRSHTGVTYIGNYKNDKRNGKGTIYWPDGDSFEGFWENGKRKGKGIFTNFQTKEVIEQEWDETEILEIPNKLK